MNHYVSVLLSFLIIALVYRKLFWHTVARASITYVPGPAVSSKGILGNFWEYYHYGVCEFVFKWQEQYGAEYQFKAVFGKDRLLISNPKVQSGANQRFAANLAAFTWEEG
ncbi:uncharacterized protein BT62DRAFT_753351 [Guyanagaster necrorhizus]|uniref:Cytochrome P450 n=1 Tax=Guyanagaster necrorhizus TaxID=856835 RepID=A0A9P8AUB7_9AGAR|nr:uncharacterized protein BT62DRAFT_753351 [Guyanagaster necrorhizus MCA 3950]KAG7448100.1 hypothetical protein BT62DRAFT_753351 [Guyanagaster necrorhizus MCA 3950]